MIGAGLGVKIVTIPMYSGRSRPSESHDAKSKRILLTYSLQRKLLQQAFEVSQLDAKFDDTRSNRRVRRLDDAIPDVGGVWHSGRLFLEFDL